MQYFFILGRENLLSLAEIESVLIRLELKAKLIAKETDFAIFDFEEKLDETLMMAQLAGTIKIGRVVNQSRNITVQALLDLIPEKETKVIFGISCYNAKLPINNLAKQLKNKLKDLDKNARFVPAGESALSSAHVTKNKLIEKGVEIVIMKSKETFFVGKTLAVQDFEKFSHFDYDRPARDTKSGMLPPKLAQMMLNLAEDSEQKCLLDPFCGSGTVLQQAIFLGYEQVIGSDLSETAVRDTATNLHWLEKELNKKINFKATKCDIKNLTSIVKPESISAIVTEPDLGPALRGHENDKELRENIQNLRDFYRVVFSQINSLLAPGRPAVIVVPEIKMRGKTYKFEINQILPPELKIAGHWQYARKDQRIIRNIYKFIKRKQ
ncbi:hypothetical protein KKC32_01140 [Patescibacteria group bacterium]|nr:hypothetical protein [Patescibacteria group bacterium]